jgi:hypothetical protein
METLRIKTYVGEDGVLKVQLPRQTVNQELEVVVVFQPSGSQRTETSATAQPSPEELGFSQNFLEEVVGSWEGKPLERPEQLPFLHEQVIGFISLPGKH